MIDKRLMKEMPKAKQFVMRQVFVQWLSLLCNIGVILLVADQLNQAFASTLGHGHLLVGFGSMLVLVLVKMILTRIQAKYSFEASKDVKYHLRKRIYEQLLVLRHTYRKHFSTSELVQLSVEGVDQLETYFGRYLPQFFFSMLAPVTLFVTLVWIDWKSSLVLLLCVPLIPISIIAIQKFAKKLLSKYWTSYANLGDSFLENLQGLTTLKIYQADEYKHKEMNKEAEHFRKITMKVLTMQLNSVTVMDIVAYGGAALGSIIALLNFAHGEVSLFGVICIVLLSAEFFLPLRLLGSFFHIAMNGIAASDKIFRLLDIERYDDACEKLDDQELTFTISDVSFGYEEDRMMLQHINATIKHGEFCAIAGESGSGKSTLAKLLMGIETNYQGSIQVQGKQRREINDYSFWNRVVYVTHQPFLMKGTVRDNLRMGNPLATKEQMIEALKQVQLYEYLQYQSGLDTMIVEGGNNLSGGQKQRLALAIALLKQGDCYIFDEATSNIDVESEECILALIKSLAKKKTVLLITHRLSAIKDCDYIYVMQEGRLVEQGTHEELMKQQALYASMSESQAALEAVRGGVA